ncbi:protein tyrosine phosphatase [Capsaspora owczarzaki ATCC 30864]|uniref:protein-tyrosine-phosphatase n=1 Tax=Capsaspora owczarzaki (strain ATCC 30864) TaxID=595528 RepID=A0A0D2UP22_CAPO3|nr:protein tyrosine phosphatase [Capsaspora owczarzaki ATCC 30864]KJE96726.1 protein tyrosine phosphatase [Capsaspora owczarzaki ATCC 30864]|eukprot:XP_004343725.2 protein tyrosine phosphatase [Capsaspora owczarzaki ATCC 30864]
MTDIGTGTGLPQQQQQPRSAVPPAPLPRTPASEGGSLVSNYLTSHPPTELDLDEEKAVDQFLSGVNVMQSQKRRPPATREDAVKFLMARKFDVARAIELFYKFQDLAARLRLETLDVSTLKDELMTGKFMVPGGRQPDNSIVFFFTANRHNPKKSSRDVALQTIVFMLNETVSTLENQRGGITFIYNMTNSNWGQFDYTLSRMVLDTLQDSFPARIRRIYVVDAPWWVSKPLAVVRGMMKEKTNGKIELVKNIAQVVGSNQLPIEFGGEVGYDHGFWVRGELSKAERKRAERQREIELFRQQYEQQQAAAAAPPQAVAAPAAAPAVVAPAVVAEPVVAKPVVAESVTAPAEPVVAEPVTAAAEPVIEKSGAAEAKAIIEKSEAASAEPVTAEPVPAEPAVANETAPQHASLEGQTALPDGKQEVIPADEDPVTEAPVAVATPLVDVFEPSSNAPELPPHPTEKPRPSYKRLLEELVHKQNNELLESEFKSVSPSVGDPTFHAARRDQNKAKNRYNNIFANDDTRVRLGVEEEGVDMSAIDYINANYIDGYSQPREFIATQGPLEATLPAFWQMIFENRVHVLVMITGLVDHGRAKCHKYWPDPEVAQESDGTPELREAAEIQANVVPAAAADAPTENWHSRPSDETPAAATEESSTAADEEDAPAAAASSAPAASGSGKNKKKKNKKKKNIQMDEPESEAPIAEVPAADAPVVAAEAPVAVAEAAAPAEPAWPPKSSTAYGDVAVRCVQETRHEHWIERQLVVSHRVALATWTLTQIQYTSWPDHGVPSEPGQVLELISHIEQLKATALERHPQGSREHPGSLTVHCSAGIGRTGTLIVSMYAIEMLNTLGMVDVLGALETVRRQRARMVETLDQYECVNRVVVEYARKRYGDDSIEFEDPFE